LEPPSTYRTAWEAFRPSGAQLLQKNQRQPQPTIRFCRCCCLCSTRGSRETDLCAYGVVEVAIRRSASHAGARERLKHDFENPRRKCNDTSVVTVVVAAAEALSGSRMNSVVFYLLLPHSYRCAFQFNAFRPGPQKKSEGPMISFCDHKTLLVVPEGLISFLDGSIRRVLRRLLIFRTSLE